MGKGKIRDILVSMSTETLAILEDNNKFIKMHVFIDCSVCAREIYTTVEAVYRQHKRGRTLYTCKSCAGKKGWVPSAREKARNKTLRLWQDPQYSGGISGKAQGRQIIAKAKPDLSYIEDQDA